MQATVEVAALDDHIAAADNVAEAPCDAEVAFSAEILLVADQSIDLEAAFDCTSPLDQTFGIGKKAVEDRNLRVAKMIWIEFIEMDLQHEMNLFRASLEKCSTKIYERGSIYSKGNSI
jgi:hypothetical protein